MSPLFTKLNLKSPQAVHVLNAPRSFDAEIALLGKIPVRRKPSAGLEFGIGFAITKTELDAVSRALVDSAAPDAVLWIAYPKGTSKKYTCEFNRDTGWEVFGQAGYEPVRMVAMDADWSALRFRKVQDIKSLTRRPETAISSAGRQRARSGGK